MTDLPSAPIRHVDRSDLAVSGTGRPGDRL
jgi:hypothetical protein